MTWLSTVDLAFLHAVRNHIYCVTTKTFNMTGQSTSCPHYDCPTVCGHHNWLTNSKDLDVSVSMLHSFTSLVFSVSTQFPHFLKLPQKCKILPLQTIIFQSGLIIQCVQFTHAQK